MKVDIPEPLVYAGVGIAIEKVIRNILGNTVKDVITNALHLLSERQRLKEIEARRVVDVMGDTLGYLDNNDYIVKGELNV